MQQREQPHSLERITVKRPETGHKVTWAKSQPVQIWSQTANKWCPGEISHITQDADGYCLDVRYWAKAQLPKAKYLAPLSECLKQLPNTNTNTPQHPTTPQTNNSPINNKNDKFDFTKRQNWNTGSKVECFSNSQKRWYKSTIVDVVRYPDDKEDWLKLQWNLGEQGQTMSKEVCRSSIWIRHRYPSLQNQMPPNYNSQPPSPMKQQRSTPNKRKNNDDIMQKILNSPRGRGLPMSEQSTTVSVTHMACQSHNITPKSVICRENEESMIGIPNMSEIGSQTPKLEAIKANTNASLSPHPPPSSFLNKKRPSRGEEEGIMERHMENDEKFNFKPVDYRPEDTQKKQDKLDADLMDAFADSSSDDDDDDDEDGNESPNGSVIKHSTDTGGDDDDEDDDETDSDEYETCSDDDNDGLENEHKTYSNNNLSLIHSGSRVVLDVTDSTKEWENEKTNMQKEIDDLKWQMEIIEQDLNDERETSGPLLKEVEMQQIRLTQLEEENAKLRQNMGSDIALPERMESVDTPIGASNNASKSMGQLHSDTDNGNDDAPITNSNGEHLDRVTALKEQFKKSRANRHSRSMTFSQEHFQSLLSANNNNNNINSANNGNSVKKNRYSGLKVKQLIDAIYDRKVTMLTEQISRQKKEMKKKEKKLIFFRDREVQQKREIQLLEEELVDLRNKQSTDNVSMYRDKVRKLTQKNEQLKKELQDALNKQKLAEMQKQDVQDEYNGMSRDLNWMQNNAQRAVQQLHNIATQIDDYSSRNSNYGNDFDSDFVYIDTIRKCNMRCIVILGEILEKNRRKRNDGLLSKLRRAKKADAIGIDDGSGNSDNGNNDNDLYQRYQSTKSARLSEQRGGGGFDFENAPVPYKAQTKLSIHRNNNNNETSVGSRHKRVSYDYVDGNQNVSIQNQHKLDLKPRNVSTKREECKHVSDEYAQTDMDEGNLSYWNEWCLIKWPRRSSRVAGMFMTSSRGFETRISLEQDCIVLKCNESNNNKKEKIKKSQIQNINVSDKQNVTILLKNNQKYKIKCKRNQEARFWYNTLHRFISSQ